VSGIDNFLILLGNRIGGLLANHHRLPVLKGGKWVSCASFESAHREIRIGYIVNHLLPTQTNIDTHYSPNPFILGNTQPTHGIKRWQTHARLQGFKKLGIQERKNKNNKGLCGCCFGYVFLKPARNLFWEFIFNIGFQVVFPPSKLVWQVILIVGFFKELWLIILNFKSSSLPLK